MATLGAIRLNTVDPDTGKKQLDVIRDALTSLSEAGVPLPSKPANGFNGTLPRNLTDLGDDELGDLLHQVSVWCGFVEAEYAKVESELSVAEAQYELIQSSVRVALRADGAKMTVQDKTDAMTTDQKVTESQSRYLFHFTKANILKAVKSAAQRDWDTVSRRITQRGQDIDRMKREGNVSSIPNPMFSRTFKR